MRIKNLFVGFHIYLHLHNCLIECAMHIYTLCIYSVNPKVTKMTKNTIVTNSAILQVENRNSGKNRKTLPILKL